MSLAPTHQQRFDRQLYLYYVGTHQQNDFKIVSKDEFNRLIGERQQSKKTFEYDKKSIYRLADSKELCLGKYGKVLGEIWREDEIESYWINQNYL